MEAVNGYINITFDANNVASRLLTEVLDAGRRLWAGAARADRVMVEHSQPNTHKTFHIGHLRNTVLGVAVSNILSAAGYPVLQATYPGDIGMHVIKCLWCYENSISVRNRLIRSCAAAGSARSMPRRTPG